MTEPPPWARPDPAAAPPPAARVRPESAPEAEPEPEPESPPLFPSDVRLFPGGPARRRTRDDVADLPRSRRHLGPGRPAPAVAPVAAPASPGRTGPPPGRRPPPMPSRPDPADDEHGTAAADPRVGVVAGPFEQGRLRRSYPGLVVLIVAAVLTVATVLGRSLSGDAPILLVAVPLAPIAGILLARRLTGGGGELTVPVWRFRVQPAEGRAGRYVIDGEIDAGVLKPGDIVRVHGDAERDGSTVATSVDILASLGGPVVRQVTGRRPGAVTAARLLSVLSIALAVLLLTLAAVVVIGPG